MITKKIFSLTAIIFLLGVTTIYAEADRYFGGWTNDNFLESTNWTARDEANDPPVLIATDNAVINSGVSAVVYTSDPDYSINKLVLGSGVDNVNTLTFLGGDILAITQTEIGSLWTPGNGVLNMQGGAFASNAVYVGHHGLGTVNMSEGYLQAWGLIKLGGNGGTGTLNISGGVMDVSSIEIVSGSVVITGGTLNITSQWVDTTATVNGYIDSGLIKAGTGYALNISSYTNPNSGLNATKLGVWKIDLNDDGNVGLLDFAVIANDWLKGVQ